MIPALRFNATVHADDYIGLDWLDRTGQVRLFLIAFRNADGTWTVR